MRGAGAGRGKPKTDRPRRGMFRRKRVCRFCVDKVDFIDYKEVRVLIASIPERGKIQPRRLSGHLREAPAQVADGYQAGLGSWH